MNTGCKLLSLLQAAGLFFVLFLLLGNFCLATHAVVFLDSLFAFLQKVKNLCSGSLLVCAVVDEWTVCVFM